MDYFSFFVLKVVVAGAGHIGQSLIHYLSLDYDIVVIDIKEDLLEKIQQRYDVQTIVGSASDPKILRKAQLDEKTAFIAVTNNDDVNLLSCQFAKAIGNPSFKVLRLHVETYDQAYKEEIMKKEWGIDLVFCPELKAQESILKSFHIPYAFDTYGFGKGQLILMGIQILPKSPFLGKSLLSVQKVMNAYNMKLVRLIRGHDAFVPKLHQTLNMNDALYFFCETKDYPAIMELFGFLREERNPIIFLGANTITHGILKALENDDRPFVVIDEKAEALNALSPYFPRVLFLHGNVFNPEILKAAHVEESSHMVCVTEDDTQNILTSLMAHTYGVPHCITLVRRIGYLSPLFAMGIEKMIHPSHSVLGEILQCLTKDYVHTFYPMEGESSGMVIEALVQSHSRALGMHVEDIDSAELHVLCVLRGQDILWSPSVLHCGDLVVVSVIPSFYQRFQWLFGYEKK